MNRISQHSFVLIFSLGMLLASCSSSTKVPVTPTARISSGTLVPTSPPTSKEPTPIESMAAAPVPEPTDTQGTTVEEEAAVQLIAVQGELSASEAEISGMAWYGDTLFILPQYPGDYPSQDGDPSLFTIQKEAILSYLDGTSSSPLEARRVPISNTNLAAQIPGYEGFEAIAIDDNRVYLAIEANDFGVMKGFLMQGAVLEGGTAIELDPNSLIELTPPVQIFNAAFESLVVSGGNVLALFEANGRQLNPDPAAYQVDPELEQVIKIDLDNYEYRFTDATGIDGLGQFWVFNIFMPLEFWYYNNQDPISTMFGKGKSHQVNNQVERLLELKYNDGKISLSGKPPVYITLDSEAAVRNWEALVRLDDRGFLAMTDTYPGTLLAFIAKPKN